MSSVPFTVIMLPGAKVSVYDVVVFVNCRVEVIVRLVMVALASIVTTCAIVTLSPAVGTTPPTHVVVALQFPVAAVVMFAADTRVNDPRDRIKIIAMAKR
jgi:hypothetical protein